VVDVLRERGPKQLLNLGRIASSFTLSACFSDHVGDWVTFKKIRIIALRYQNRGSLKKGFF
jgi:hypothetical protein